VPTRSCRGAVLARRARRATVLVAVAVSAGCGGAGEAGAAADVASRFHAAVARQDGVGACALLAPQTRSELEQAAGRPCPAAVLGEEVPKVGPVRAGRRFGTQAQVRFEGDTVFLAEFPGGWRVVAAACTHRNRLPYDCEIKGI
jgi:hypothetical protein